NTPLAWAREMNATDVINELEKRGAVADKEWHGEKLEMKTNEQRAEEGAFDENDPNEEEGDYQSEPGDVNGIQTGRFEIEVEDPKTKRQNSSKDSNITDALQRQRPTTKIVF
ncbi:unnamed protein product, partial [Adineta ricciae]